MKKKNIGSSFDSWLREEGTYEEVTATAIKRVLARQVEAAMKEKHFSKAEMARRMHTSRAALDRLLDPDYDAVTLSTLRKAATAVGRELGARGASHPDLHRPPGLGTHGRRPPGATPGLDPLRARRASGVGHRSGVPRRPTRQPAAGVGGQAGRPSPARPDPQ